MAARPKYPWIDEKLRSLAVPIESLKPDPDNPRSHDARNLNAIGASLMKHGQVSPLVVNAKNNQVVIGNGRLEAAIQIGWTHIAAIVRPMTAKQQRALSIADNRTAELAEWDQTILDAQLALLEAEEPDLYGDLLLAELAESVGQFDVDGVDMPSLASGDREPFQQMTFTLSDDQAADVKRAVAAAKDAGPFVDTGNENSNGNALARIVEAYLGTC